MYSMMLLSTTTLLILTTGLSLVKASSTPDAIIAELRQCGLNTGSFHEFSACFLRHGQLMQTFSDEDFLTVLRTVKCSRCSNEDKRYCDLELIHNCSSAFIPMKRRIEMIQADNPNLPSAVTTAFHDYLNTDIRCRDPRRVLNFHGGDPNDPSVVQAIWQWTQTAHEVPIGIFNGPIIYDRLYPILNTEDSLDFTNIDTVERVLASVGEFHGGQIAEERGRNIIVRFTSSEVDVRWNSFDGGFLFVEQIPIKAGATYCFIERRKEEDHVHIINYEGNMPMVMTFVHPSQKQYLDRNMTLLPILESVLNATIGESHLFLSENLKAHPAPLPLRQGTVESRIASVWLLKKYLLGQDISTAANPNIDWQRELKMMLAEYFTGRLITAPDTPPRPPSNSSHNGSQKIPTSSSTNQGSQKIPTSSGTNQGSQSGARSQQNSSHANTQGSSPSNKVYVGIAVVVVILAVLGLVVVVIMKWRSRTEFKI